VPSAEGRENHACTILHHESGAAARTQGAPYSIFKGVRRAAEIAHTRVRALAATYFAPPPIPRLPSSADCDRPHLNLPSMRAVGAALL